MVKKQAEALAKKLGMVIDETLGSGSNGTAFSTECGKVVKITRDAAEFCHATNMKGKDLEFFANVEDTFVFPDGKFGIVMEQLEVCEEVARQFYELRMLAEAQGTDLIEVDVDDHPDFDLFEELKDDIARIYKEDHKNKLLSSDLHEDNIGLKEDGTIAAFDLRHDYQIMNNVIDLDAVVSKVKAHHKVKNTIEPTVGCQ